MNNKGVKMQEHKFRAWDRKRNEWYGESNKQHSLVFYGFHIFGECTMLCPPDADDLEYLEIEQYTGTKDKNDNEIYEGDIVRDDYDRILTIISDDVFAGYAAVGKNTSILLTINEAKEMEVVDNIHKNIKLTKEKQNEI